VPVGYGSTKKQVSNSVRSGGILPPMVPVTECRRYDSDSLTDAKLIRADLSENLLLPSKSVIECRVDFVRFRNVPDLSCEGLFR